MRSALFRNNPMHVAATELHATSCLDTALNLLSEHEDARADGDIGHFFHDVVARSFIFQYSFSIRDQVIQSPLVLIDAD
jgi:hypothetical protein